MRFLRPLVAAGVLCLVALVLWLGRFRYFRDDGLSFRENRFTGGIDAFVVGQWYRIPQRAKPVGDAIADYRRKHPPADTGMIMDTTRNYSSDNPFRPGH